MSFSLKIKEELTARPAKKKHCVLAELSAMGSGSNMVNKRQRVLVGDNLLEQECCQRAYIRGSFIAWGTCSDPEKSYHMEFNLPTEEAIEQLCKAMECFDLHPKQDKKRIYFKEGSSITHALNVMGAHLALMDYENIRIVKEIKNNVNRQINFDMANIGKTISAAAQQLEDIKYIAENEGLGVIPEPLEAIALLRLENTEATLKEIGQMLSPPIGKSGVNHRLRKISAIATELREQKEENY